MNKILNYQCKKIKRQQSRIDKDIEKITELEDQAEAFTQNTGKRTKNSGKNMKGCYC